MLDFDHGAAPLAAEALSFFEAFPGTLMQSVETTLALVYHYGRQPRSDDRITRLFRACYCLIQL